MLLLTVMGATPASTRVSDPLFDLQWHHQTVRTPEAWAVTTGTGMTIAVIDGGIDLTHPDLPIAGGVSDLDCPEPGGCGGGGLGRGPANAHGTHVAGIAAAKMNGFGGVGIAPGAEILSINEDAGIDIRSGILWAIAHDADVINISLALPGSGGVGLAADVARRMGLLQSNGVAEAIEQAVDNDVVVVVSAGNEPVVPYCNELAITAICVTATDRRDLSTSYSNKGFMLSGQTLAAPGGEYVFQPVSGPGAPRLLPCNERILSTFPITAGRDYDNGCGSTSGDHGYMAGTSMAAPIVSGVAALVKSLGCSARETIEILLSTARMPHGITQEWFPGYGHGIVDSAAAVGRAVQTCRPLQG